MSEIDVAASPEQPVKKTKKKKKKKGGDNLDALLNAQLADSVTNNDAPEVEFETAGNGTAAATNTKSAFDLLAEPEDESDMPDVSTSAKKKAKKKKKKKGGGDLDALLNAQLEDKPSSDAPEIEFESPENGAPGASFAKSAYDLLAEPEDDETETPSIITPAKKKKKKKKGGDNLDMLLNAQLEDIPANDAAEIEFENPSAMVANPFDLLEEPDQPDDASKQTTSKKSKKKKKAKAAPKKQEEEDLDALLNEFGDSGNNFDDVKQKSSTSAAATAAGNDMDDLMAELEGDSGSGKTSASQKKKAKKKKQKAATKAKDDDIDALMNELGGDPVGNKDDVPTSAPTTAPVNGADEVDDLLAELVDDDAGPAKLTAAQKKKAKKKKKKTQQTEEQKGTEPTEAPTGKKAKKKESAVVRRAREQQERIAAAAEQERLLREAEEKRIEEEERKKREEEEKKAAARAKRKAADKARKERKRAEGTLLTKAEREKKKKADAFLAQLRAQGALPTESASADGAPSQRQSAVVYSRRRKRKPNASGSASHEPEKPKKELPEEQAEKSETKVETPDISKLKIDDTEEKKPPMVSNWEDMSEESEKEEAENEIDIEDEAESKPKKLSEAVNNESEEEEEDDDGEDEEDSDSDDETSDSSYESDEDRRVSKTQLEAQKRRSAIRQAHLQRRREAYAARTPDKLRSPVICIMGHVDTGKTKILDRIRRTHVQDDEAGGITQQIGATYFPIEAVKKETFKIEEGRNLDYNVPSLLIIDTPGHESFTNLRTRGSSLCDIAILVIDIMHGIEPQTRESIGLLKQRRTPFIVALNKIDRIYDWKAQPDNCPTRDSLAKQTNVQRTEFDRRVEEAKLALQQEGFNSELYWKNEDIRKYISIVPTSAITGEGIPDLLMLLLSLPQKLLVERLMYNSILEATLLEVKVIDGLGTTIDVILTGGLIRGGDTIVVAGLEGPIVTTIRALLTPHPMKEMRVKGQYQRHNVIHAAQGVKISAEGLEKAVAGTQLLVVPDPNDEDELEYAKKEVMTDFSDTLKNAAKTSRGVYVQASTLGSLEALLEFLKTSSIPVSAVNIGPVHKRDVNIASTMLEKAPEYAVILAFDVKVETEAKELAEDVGVTIYTADIIYNLFDMFETHMADVKKRKRDEASDDAVFPSISEILPSNVYNKKNPIVMGVKILEGQLKVGTPLVVQRGEAKWFDIGRVVDIRKADGAQVKIGKQAESVCIKIQGKTDSIMYGRHFTAEDKLVSKMSRKAIDLLKEHFRNELSTEDWRLVVKLKSMFQIEAARRVHRDDDDDD